MTILTKGQVNKAGDILRHNKFDDDALNTIGAWRALHIYPLQLAFNLLKKYTDRVGNKAIYGQRLKRLPSILYKLNRFPEIKLSRIQDIGGCRVILTDYDKLRVLSHMLRKSKNILENYKDYITYPKHDGYRSIHLIYCCNSRKKEYDGLKIEFQLRTKLQHAWATAVEIVDTFSGQKLKLGEGDPDWKRFFYLVADEFAKVEGLPLHDNSIITDRMAEIKQLLEQLKVFEKLDGYASTIRTIESIREKSKFGKKAVHIINDSCYVVCCNLQIRNINLFEFNHISDAQEHYLMLEKTYLDTEWDIVLVRNNSIKNLKKAYPNYFADTQIFCEELKKELNSHINILDIALQEQSESTSLKQLEKEIHN